MNILIITSTFPTKSITHQNIFVYTQAKKLADRGHKVYVVAAHTESRKEGNLNVIARENSIIKMFFSGIALGVKIPSTFFLLAKNLGIKRTIGFFSLCAVCLDLLKKRNIDIVDGHWIDGGGIVAYLISKISGKNYLVTEHGILAEVYDGAVGKRSENESKIIKMVLDNADKIITESNDLIKFINLYTNKKPVLVHYGIDLSKFKPQRKKIFNRPTFLNVGGLTKRKNHIDLLKSFKMIIDEGYDADLLIIGKGHEKENLYEFVKDSNLFEKVKFIDYMDNQKLPVYYSSSVAFVLSSLHEGFGLVFIEAEACGCPCIAYNLYAIPEAIGDGGILVEPRNVASFANSMKKLLDDKNLRKELSKKAVKHAKNFSIEKRVEKIEKIYKKSIKSDI
jgi:glycosyltransferase involved in cell wall biosynthesis